MINQVAKVDDVNLFFIEEYSRFYQFDPTLSPIFLTSDKIFEYSFTLTVSETWTNLDFLNDLTKKMRNESVISNKLKVYFQMQLVKKIRLNSKEVTISLSDLYLFKSIQAIDITNIPKMSSVLIPLLRIAKQCNIYKDLINKEQLALFDQAVSITKATNLNMLKNSIKVKKLNSKITKSLNRHVNSSLFLAFKLTSELTQNHLMNLTAFISQESTFVHKSIQMKQPTKKIKQKENRFLYVSRKPSVSVSINNAKTGIFMSLAQNLPEIKHLVKLNLSNNNIPSNEFYLIFKNLRNMQELVKLKLCGNNLKCYEVCQLSENITGLSQLKYLNLSKNVIQSKAYSFLATALRNLVSLEYLNLSSNRISEEDIAVLKNSFYNLTNLQYLFLENCFLKVNQLVALLPCLNRNLKLLNISKNRLDSPNFDLLCLEMSNLRQLNELFLNYCNLHDVELISLFNALSENKLKTLEMKHNNATEKTCEIFFKMEIYMGSLEKLAFSLENPNSNVTYKMASIMNRALSNFNCLSTLDLSHMGFTIKEISQITPSFPFLRLKKLVLKRNNMSIPSIKELLEYESFLQELEYLDLGNNPLESKAIRKLSELLGKLKNLQVLKLKQLKMGYKDLKVVMESAAGNKHLSHLDLSFNEFGFYGLDYLVQKVKEYPKLQILAVRGIKDANSNVGYCVVDVSKRYYSNLSILFK